MKLAMRDDGTVVYMDSLDGPYHVCSKDVDPYGKYDLDEMLQYAQAHPKDVVKEPEPEIPTPEQREVAELTSYLASTDWYDIRSIKGKATPDEITIKRNAARERISFLRGDKS